MKNIFSICSTLSVSMMLAAFPTLARAKMNVVTSTTDLRALAAEVGGDAVNADSIAKGTQDPHYIEAKPSFMTKVSHADLVLAVGLDLEIGWLPSIIRGARNPKVNPGGNGYLELGPALKPIEIPSGSVTRAQGDVHPFGNPHVWLDPKRAGQAAGLIAERLAVLDAAHAEQYRARAKALQERLETKTKDWQERIEKTGVKKVITYHKTLNYFLDRFQIECSANLEPKPGIPPTSGHILQVIQTIKGQNVSLILVENFFDPTVTKRIKQDVPGIRVQTVPVAVEGEEGLHSLDDLYEQLVRAIEGK